MFYRKLFTLLNFIGSAEEYALNNREVKSTVADETVERFVKEYLDIIILALIARKPMCGTDIMDIIHRDFNVLLSPGTIYPLLHRLRVEGLLECEYRIKKKIYRPAKGVNIRSILEGHRATNENLNNFLKLEVDMI